MGKSRNSRGILLTNNLPQLQNLIKVGSIILGASLLSPVLIMLSGIRPVITKSS